MGRPRVSCDQLWSYLVFVYIYSNEADKEQPENEAEKDENWSRLDPFPERRWQLQQGCRDAHCLIKAAECTYVVGW